MVNWDQWQTLLAVFRAGSYAKAAVALQVNATTVGRRLKLLEQQLGYALFLRHEGRFYPTHQCEDLIAHVEAASEVLRRAEQDSAVPDSGVVWRDLRMTAPPFLIRHLFAPTVADLVSAHRLRIELLGTGSHVSLSRREADIAVRIEDRKPRRSAEADHVEAERIGVLTYAVYRRRGGSSHDLPWAGLMEDHVRTTGDDVMLRLTGGAGFRFRTYHFDALAEIVAAGSARAMLPCLVARDDARLEPASDVVLEQPLWMLHHRQDRDVRHQQGARSWVRACARDGLESDVVPGEPRGTVREAQPGMS